MSTTPQNDAIAVRVNNLLSTIPYLRSFSSQAPSVNDEKKFKFEIQMRGRFLGAMPVMKFMDKYLSPKGGMVDAPSHLQNRIGSAPQTSDEESMYDPFVKAIADFIPGFKAENTSNKPTRSEFADFQLNPDVCLFNANFDFKDFEDKSYFSVMEMWIEFEHEEAPFADPPAGNETDHTTHAFAVDSESAKLARRQLTAYAVAQHTQQSRYFSFSVSIVKNHARFLRWNPVGIVITEEFDYIEKPELMAKFLWNFSHLTDEQRGYDLSIPMEKGEPSTQDVQGTDKSCMSAKGRVVYLKDAWRCRYGDGKKIDIECEIYGALNATSIPHIPKLECRGDNGSTTDMHKLANEAGLISSKPETTGFTHCRLVLEVAGRALSMFKSTKELVNGVLCAMVAHKKALESLKLLHRDVSFGNIILTDDGSGWLIDWDVRKHRDEMENSRIERTGTWQFTSAKLLRSVKRCHTVVDDLESFLHVLVWTTVRYVPSSEGFSFYSRKKHLNSYLSDDASRVIGVNGLVGGAYLQCHGFELKDPSPLPTLLEKFTKTFQSRYTDPPTAEERLDYDLNQERLKSHTYFINTIKDALEDAWPPDDKADLSLIDDPGNRMMIQAQQMKESRMDVDQKQLENLNSNGTAGSGSLKREHASPAPAPSKRCRVTPLGSGMDA